MNARALRYYSIEIVSKVKKGRKRKSNWWRVRNRGKITLTSETYSTRGKASKSAVNFSKATGIKISAAE